MASVARTLEFDRNDCPTPVLDLPCRSRGPVGENRRMLPRMSGSFIARPRDGGQSMQGVDLSFGGMMCVGAEPTWPGNCLDLDLILPGEHKSLAVVARVVELVSFRGTVAMRLRFESASEATRKRIAGWMAHRSAS